MESLSGYPLQIFGAMPGALSEPYETRIEARKQALLTELDNRINQNAKELEDEIVNYDRLMVQLSSKYCKGEFTKEGKELRDKIFISVATIRCIDGVIREAEQQKVEILAGRDVRVLDKKDFRGRLKIVDEIVSIAQKKFDDYWTALNELRILRGETSWLSKRGREVRSLITAYEERLVRSQVDLKDAEYQRNFERLQIESFLYNKKMVGAFETLDGSQLLQKIAEYERRKTDRK